mgnify:CR=1 FL=1
MTNSVQKNVSTHVTCVRTVEQIRPDIFPKVGTSGHDSDSDVEVRFYVTPARRYLLFARLNDQTTMVLQLRRHKRRSGSGDESDPSIRAG